MSNPSEDRAEPARRSLRKRVSLAVVTVLLFAVPFSAAAFFISSFISVHDELQKEERRLTGLINSALAQALWDIDEEGVRSHGENIARDWNVAYLRVSDDHSVLFEYGKLQSDVFAQKEPITLRLERKGQSLGTVVFSMDSRPYLNAAVESALFAFVALLILLSFVLVALRIAILKELRGPLDDIALLVSSFGSGSPTSSPRDSLRYVEFDSLRSLLIVMGDTIKKQIGELESSLKERDILMREINHRVKNNLQLLAAIIDQQAENDGRERVVLKKLLGRIEFIAVAYDQLWVSKRLNGIRMDEYLIEISRLISFSPRFPGIRIESHFDPLYFPLDYAMHCGLMFYELAVNAAEHAYGGTGGRIDVSLTRKGDEITLSVQDAGQGCETPFTNPPPNGLGFRFVGALADQLGAEVAQHSGDGCRFSIRFPASPIDAALSRELYSS